MVFPLVSSLPCTYTHIKKVFKTFALGVHDPVIMNLAVVTGLFLNHELEKGKAPSLFTLTFQKFDYYKKYGNDQIFKG